MRATGRRRVGGGVKLLAVMRRGGGAKLLAVMHRGEGAKPAVAPITAKRNHALRRRQSIDAARYRIQSAHRVAAQLSHGRLRFVEDDDCSERSQSAARCSADRRVVWHGASN